MAFLPQDDNLNYLKTLNNLKELNVSTEKEENNDSIQKNPILHVMNDLISTMHQVNNELISTIQQLQKMFVQQMPNPNQQNIQKTLTKEPKDTNLETKSPSQTEVLLQQVQNAMESTITQLSNRDRALNNLDLIDSENKMAVKELSTSEKWRLYTEMYQTKHESSTEFCVNKMKLGQELGLTFKETKREMLIGLWSNRLAVVLYLKQHENEEELVNDIEEWEKIENARSEVFKKFRNKREK